jgi:gamma-glutamyltranspeptidase/glutathione hydrolase
MAQRGMVATSHPLASQAGLEALRRGGSAVDAAIAANAMLGLVEPTGAGVGGDLFAIVWSAPHGRLFGLNASGRSPRALQLADFQRRGLSFVPELGPLPVSVPGAVDGWCELHSRFGRQSMGELLSPAIHYARAGFPVTEIVAGNWAGDAARLARYPGFAAVFMPSGRAPAAGEIFRNSALADSYELLAKEGRSAFYEGDIARSMADYMHAQGGYLSMADLRAHRSQWQAPLHTTYRDHEVWELPPNGQGIAVLQMLNLLEAYDLGRLRWGSAEHLHLLIETKKLAFEDRARHYADPDFVDVPVAGLLSKEYAESRRSLLRPDAVLGDLSWGDPDVLGGGDTVYLCTADSDGNMVSLIQSNYKGMGSGMTPPGCGFVLHNRGELFALDPSHPNVYAPGKRPFHTIIPAFLTRAGKPLMAFGVMGADMQPQGHVQVLSNLIDFGMNVQVAGDAARLRHEGSSTPTGRRMQGSGVVHMESGFPPDSAAELTALGHRIAAAKDGYGGYQAIYRNPENGVYMGASESRKDGHAVGY